MAPITRSFGMADRLADGKLAKILRAYRTEGASYDTIAARLWADFEIEVSGQTIKNWLDKLEVAA